MQGLNSSVITAHEVLNVQGPNYGQLADANSPTYKIE